MEIVLLGFFLIFKRHSTQLIIVFCLDKRHIYGIRGIAHDWFSSYMYKRHQSVMYNNFESDYKEIKYGVPQGSVLGPLLFLIYINDLPSVSKLVMPILFADDTNLFCTGKNFGDIVNEINMEIDKIYSWVKANKLSLNVEKLILCYSHLNVFHEIWTTYS